MKKKLHELKTTTQKNIELLQKDVAILKSQSVINMSKMGPQTQSSEKKVMFETIKNVWMEIRNNIHRNVCPQKKTNHPQEQSSLVKYLCARNHCHTLPIKLRLYWINTEMV